MRDGAFKEPSRVSKELPVSEPPLKVITFSHPARAREGDGGQNSGEETYFVLLGLSRCLWATTVFCLLILTCVVTVFGNGLILLLLSHGPWLHTSMSFFLSSLSLVGVCFTMSRVPQMLANCSLTLPVVSLAHCLAPMAVGPSLSVVECLLLAAMACDSCVAIMDPWRYSLHMGPRLCGLLARTLWTAVFLLTMVPVLAVPLEFCGHQVISHFSCELLALLQLACSHRLFCEALTKSSHSEVRVSPRSSVAIPPYVALQEKVTHDGDKVISTCYGILTPTVDPVIGSLRNKDRKGVFRRLLGRKPDF
ncbi:olfactory receptor 13H1-like [Enhydra lutris kenyoni]|uniref:Olfactory receptor 13H1-like n=1 Tax=Enhydra lutris kenyoni TaxID=391180 RepID=A0A2Y9IK31_ENHLU|nr:olfactory receptor 13H1-like [Enhydra lutris kenyoni]